MPDISFHDQTDVRSFWRPDQNFALVAKYSANKCMHAQFSPNCSKPASPRAASLAAREGAGMYVHFALKITYTGIIYGIYRINKSINY